MTLTRKAAAAAALLAIPLLTVGCGDVFRPVATPVVKAGGDPLTQHIAQVLTSNGGGTGNVTEIDISGDTVSSIHVTGKGPVYVTSTNNGVITYVANAGDDTLTAYATQTSTGNESTIVLPTGSKPVFLALSGSHV